MSGGFKVLPDGESIGPLICLPTPPFMEVSVPTQRKPKQVKVHATGCTPANLELFTGKDSVIFLQSGPDAPSIVHVDASALFGTTTCQVGAAASDATVYSPLAPGNYTLGVSPAAAKQVGGQGTVQVLCLRISGAMGSTDSGTIKVTR